jgi:hypothetical protein
MEARSRITSGRPGRCELGTNAAGRWAAAKKDFYSINILHYY